MPLRLAYAGTLTEMDDADVPAGGGAPGSEAGGRTMARDLVARALTEGLSRRGLDAPGGTLHLTSDIPLGRGLGSSAAAVVAGLALAAAQAGTRFDRDVALVHAVELEGHPDNAAPALFGGLMAAARTATGDHHCFRLPLGQDLTFAYAAPGTRLSTVEGRRVLPATLPHAQAMAGLGRAMALVHGLATGDPALLRTGFADDLHVPYRLPLIPGGKEAMAAALGAGAWAVTVSGSGSGLFAVCPPAGSVPVAEAMAEVFGAHGPAAVGLSLQPDRTGVETR